MGPLGNIWEFLRYMWTPLSDEKLATEYEKIRLLWVKDGDPQKRYWMDKMNEEMVKRANKKFEEEHPNASPRHREHGWYLPNDDD